MPPLISVVIPVRDGERYLGEAIDSVLAQDHRPLEVIVVDNASTDASGAIAASYGQHVRVVRQDEGRGPAARNRGILESRGGYLAFLDADDRFRPGKLSAQLAILESDPALHACLCTAENFWEPGLEAERERYAAAGRIRATHTFGAMLARRGVFDEIGLLSTSDPHGDQVEWFLRAVDAGVRLFVMPEVLVDRRMHAESISHSGERVMDVYVKIVAERIARARAG